jgi:hypothetical protein
MRKEEISPYLTTGFQQRETVIYVYVYVRNHMYMYVWVSICVSMFDYNLSEYYFCMSLSDYWISAKRNGTSYICICIHASPYIHVYVNIYMYMFKYVLI